MSRIRLIVFLVEVLVVLAPTIARIMKKQDKGPAGSKVHRVKGDPVVDLEFKTAQRRTDYIRQSPPQKPYKDSDHAADVPGGESTAD